MKKIKVYSVNDNPHTQPTPVLVFGEPTTHINIDDVLYLVNRPRVSIRVTDIIDGDEKPIIGMLNEKPVRFSRFALFFKKIQDIPKEQQEFFMHNQEVDGHFNEEGVFIPDEKYLINYSELFSKYFELIIKQFYQDRVQYELCRFWDSAIEELGVAVFNEYIRVNFLNQPNDDKTFNNAYEYGFEFFNSDDRFTRVVFNHLLRLDINGLFIDGIKTIVYGEKIKLDFKKIIL